MMGLLLSLIVAVAAFNIITSLGLMVMEKQGEVAILQTGADSAPDHGGIYGPWRQRRHHRRAARRGAGALLASQLNNLMPIIGALLDGAALPVAIEPLGGRYCAGRDGHCAAFYALSFRRAAATQPAEALRYE